jgi:hypothetical protein
MSSTRRRSYIVVSRIFTSIMLWVGGLVLLVKALLVSVDQMMCGAFGVAALVAALLIWATG